MINEPQEKAENIPQDTEAGNNKLADKDMKPEIDENEVNEDVNEGVYDDDLHSEVIERRKIVKSNSTLLKGLSWFTYGWQLFKKTPILFVIGAILWVAVEVGFAFIPYAGEIIDGLLFPVLYAGFLFAARDADEKGKVSITAFFKGFSDFSKVPQLFMLGLPMVSFEVIEFLVLETVGPLIALLMAAPLMVMVLCGLLYAVPLVIFKDYQTLDAIKSSYRICGNNVSSLITVFFMMLVFSIVGIVTFGVGFAVIIPVTFCALYKSQKDLYKSV